MKKKGVLALGIMAVSGWTMLASFSNVADAPVSSSADEPAPSAVSSSSESYETSNSSSELSSSEAENEPYVFTDSNKNGIPDEIEDYYDSHIRDQYVFGISLGSVICGALYLFTLVFKWQRDKKFDKATLGKINDLWDAEKSNVESSKQYQQIISDLNAKYNELDASYKVMVGELTKKTAEISADFSAKTAELVDRFNQQNSELNQKIAENDEKNRKTLDKVTKSIDSYSKVNKKVNVVLENQALIVKSAEYTKNGVNEQVSAKVKEATEDVEREE